MVAGFLSLSLLARLDKPGFRKSPLAIAEQHTDVSLTAWQDNLATPRQSDPERHCYLI